ncbi:hypothetical protein E2C01_030964 [Portunus trituberculatus]|uniref:Uncharacterized protein n=1 Tax=Portunus trituberculatus TaxID=210409 RepID=A0A5B7EXA1_PORTR|nr:hypothetical protein [Portunus trituberculatus]
MVGGEQDDNQSHQNSGDTCLHLLGGSPFSPAHPGPSSPPSGSRSAKLLDVTVDDQLTWKQHVTTTVRLAAYRLYMLRRLKSLGIPTDELKGIFLTFIQPRLIVCLHSMVLLPQLHPTATTGGCAKRGDAGSSLALPTLITITP